MLDGALRAAFAAPVNEVIVVTGADEAVETAARAFAGRTVGGHAARLHQVHAPRWREGLSASLRAGIEAVSPAAAGAFVFLGDMPATPHEIAATLAACYAAAANVDAVEPLFEGRPAHPVLIGRSLFARLASLSGEQGARAAFTGARVRRIEVTSAGATLDVDTPDALAALRPPPGRRP